MDKRGGFMDIINKIKDPEVLNIITICLSILAVSLAALAAYINLKNIKRPVEAKHMLIESDGVSIEIKTFSSYEEAYAEMKRRFGGMPCPETENNENFIGDMGASSKADGINRTWQIINLEETE